MTNIGQTYPGFIRDQCDQWDWQLVVFLLSFNVIKITLLSLFHHFKYISKRTLISLTIAKCFLLFV